MTSDSKRQVTSEKMLPSALGEFQGMTVPAHGAGMRVDKFLAQLEPSWSRSQIQVWIEAQHLLLNGKPVKVSHLLKGGESLQLHIPAAIPLEALPQALPLEIVFEDSDLLVVNKAAEMVVHPGAGHFEGTLVNAVLHHCRDLSGIGGKLRPGIVHRLDKGTSGLLVIAKNDFAHQHLMNQFQERRVEKIYHAFVWGTPSPASGWITSPLGRHPQDRKKISSQGKQTREAQTHYRVEKTWGALSLLEVKPRTGRTHQIRVHLAELGHGVVGDPSYGRGLRRTTGLPPRLLQNLRGLSFQLLHASHLRFVHPRLDRALEFHAPFREEMRLFQLLLDEELS